MCDTQAFGAQLLAIATHERTREAHRGGDHQKALDIYKEMLEAPDADPTYNAYCACCYFYMGMYQEARDILEQAPDDGLRRRLAFHLAHKFKEEESLVQFAEVLSGGVEDQLSHAAINYLRNHFQEATDIYKRLQALEYAS